MGTSYRISIGAEKIKDIEPDAYGNILFSISKRRLQHPKSKATHNIYLCRDPQNYLGDKYALLNLSLNKQKVLSLENSYGNCEIVALKVSEQSREKDHARATHVVTNNLSKEDRGEGSKRINLGKGWVINHQKQQDQISGEKTGGERASKLYVGNGILKEAGELRFINVIIDQDKLKNLPAANGHVYINLSGRKDKDSEFAVYFSPSKYDRWAQFTISLDREKTLSITPTENGYLPITLSYRKKDSIGMDNANINVRANSYFKGYDPGSNSDGFDTSRDKIEDHTIKQDFYVGKGWSRDFMYWMKDHSEEIPQVQTIEMANDMEGRGVTNLGLHIFQTVKAAPDNGETAESIPDTSNSYYLKDGRVYQENRENSILPFNGYPFEEFVQNYEVLSKDFQTSVFYNIQHLAENEKNVFLSNAPSEIKQIKDEKKNSPLINAKEEGSKVKNTVAKEPMAKTVNKAPGRTNKQRSGLSIG